MISPNAVSSNEPLGRFLLSRRHFNRERKEVNFKAFLPPNDLQLSVFRIEGLKLLEIWDIGQNDVVNVQKEPRTLYGVASIKTSEVELEKLSIVPDNEPPRHASIIGWPKELDAQMDIANILAVKSLPIFKD